jgi:hypothetical protein
MRSDTCNNYYCPELKAFAPNAIDPPRAFFAAGSADAVQAAGFVEENQLRRLDRAVDSSADTEFVARPSGPGPATAVNRRESAE